MGKKSTWHKLAIEHCTSTRNTKRNGDRATKHRPGADTGGIMAKSGSPSEVGVTAEKRETAIRIEDEGLVTSLDTVEVTNGKPE